MLVLAPVGNICYIFFWFSASYYIFLVQYQLLYLSGSVPVIISFWFNTSYYIFLVQHQLLYLSGSTPVIIYDRYWFMRDIWGYRRILRDIFIYEDIGEFWEIFLGYRRTLWGNYWTPASLFTLPSLHRTCPCHTWSTASFINWVNYHEPVQIRSGYKDYTPSLDLRRDINRVK